MTNKLKGGTARPKLAYQSPKIEVIVLEMEQGIATGSASVGSKPPASDFIQEWDTANDRESTIDWGN